MDVRVSWSSSDSFCFVFPFVSVCCPRSRRCLVIIKWFVLFRLPIRFRVLHAHALPVTWSYWLWWVPRVHEMILIYICHSQSETAKKSRTFDHHSWHCSTIIFLSYFLHLFGQTLISLQIIKSTFATAKQPKLASTVGLRNLLIAQTVSNKAWITMY